ncbi:DUF7331 family protein [Halomarina litorea]|uniref:DUF7331 family protein n=1 Tax=Halomarina litorea TaxID=2961595 RepID=UPI0020C59C28|nr:hypothetical protein [Halomarina sp. BCD28]
MTPTTDSRDAVRRRDHDGEGALYAFLELVTGEGLVYDRRNHRAWVQSDAVVPLADAV